MYKRPIDAVAKYTLNLDVVSAGVVGLRLNARYLNKLTRPGQLGGGMGSLCVLVRTHVAAASACRLHLYVCRLITCVAVLGSAGSCILTAHTYRSSEAANSS